MRSKSDNIETMINDEADEVVEELFKSLKYRHQYNVFNYFHLLQYKCHKVNPNCGR